MELKSFTRVQSLVTKEVLVDEGRHKVLSNFTPAGSVQLPVLENNYKIPGRENEFTGNWSTGALEYSKSEIQMLLMPPLWHKGTYNT